MSPPPDESGSEGSDSRSDEPWPEDEGPFYAWLPPEDRLWLHPSEAAGGPSPALTARRRSRLPSALTSTWVVAVVAGLVGALTATGVGVASGIWPHDTTVVRPTVESSDLSMADVGTEPVDWNSVLDSIDPSVVGLTVQGATGTVQGSGLVVAAADGVAYVVTDQELLSTDMAAGYLGSVDVTFYSGQTERARLVGQDPTSGLAVLSTGDPAGVVRADLGSVSGLDDADQVLAVGSWSVQAISTGPVSGEDLSVSLTDGAEMDELLAVTMPALGAGADGGPLLDQYGQVVGITVGVQPAAQADPELTFAVPGDEVVRVASEIIQGQDPTHPWLGVTDATAVPSAIAHTVGLQGGVEAGDVEPGSPAAKAGMRSNDILVSFNGHTLDSAGGLIAALNECDPGRRVDLTYIHDGRTITTSVKMADEPSNG